MNGSNFFKWVKEKLNPNLPPKSVLVVDNAPYHNLQEDKCPTQASRKAEIQAWMTRHQINFEATVRILYTGERYNGIFDFRQKFRGDGFFPIKITTL